MRGWSQRNTVREAQRAVAHLEIAQQGSRNALLVADAARKAVGAFIALSFVERLGWFLFGERWLVNRLERQRQLVEAARTPTHVDPDPARDPA